jgi:hypothetical protein
MSFRAPALSPQFVQALNLIEVQFGTKNEKEPKFDQPLQQDYSPYNAGERRKKTPRSGESNEPAYPNQE